MRRKRALSALLVAGALAFGGTVLAANPQTASAAIPDAWTTAAVSGNGTYVLQDDGTLAIAPDNDYTSANSTRRSGGVRALDKLPEKFDLRKATFKNIDGEEVTGSFVTPVKFQNPFNDCWGFSLTAAAESSYLSELGIPWEASKSAEMPNGLDFSEKHTVWFSFNPVPEGDELGQSGEGLYDDVDHSVNSSDAFNHGGTAEYGTSLFGSGVGPIDESIDPSLKYVNSEGTYETFRDDYVMPSADGDWSLDPSLRRLANAELEESYYLPSPASTTTAADGTKTYTFNQAGIDAIKEQLLKGRAVTISYYADQGTTYMNQDTWSQYTYEPVDVDHGVCIVGWDDTWSRDNFLADHKPDRDGAFIVKNSWGAVDSTYGNRMDWGVDGSGYFYLSYYDQTLSLPESYDFVTPNDDDLQYGKDTKDYTIDWYRYSNLPGNPTSQHFNGKTGYNVSVANVYEMIEPSIVRTVSAQSYGFNTTMRFDIYRLNDGATEPTDGELVWSKVEKYPYGGLHRVELDEPLTVAKGDKLGVVITSFTTDPTDGSNVYEAVYMQYPSETYAKASTYTKGNQVWAEAKLNPGESFLGEANTVTTDDYGQKLEDYDWTDFAEFIDGQTESAQQAWDQMQLDVVVAERDQAVAAVQADPTEDNVANLTKLQTALSQIIQQYGVQLAGVCNATDNFPITLSAEPIGTAVGRLYNPFSGEHLFTANGAEGTSLVAQGWQNEGVGWVAAKESGTPIYRLYNPYTHEHFYTRNEAEAKDLETAGWKNEDVQFYSDDAQAVPVYRLFNPNSTDCGAHLFTTSATERDDAKANGWRDEDIAF